MNYGHDSLTCLIHFYGLLVFSVARRMGCWDGLQEPFPWALAQLKTCSVSLGKPL